MIFSVLFGFSPFHSIFIWISSYVYFIFILNICSSNCVILMSVVTLYFHFYPYFISILICSSIYISIFIFILILSFTLTLFYFYVMSILILS